MQKNYEELFAVPLSAAPSLLRANLAQSAARLVETEKRLEEAEKTIMGLLGEPLSRNVSGALRASLASLPRQSAALADQRPPPVQLENHAAFAASVDGLGAWIKSRMNQAHGILLPCASQWMAALVESRALAEEGKATEALEKASTLHPALSETRKQALVPFLEVLFWELLRTIEQDLDQGHKEKAAALADRGRAIIERTPSLGQFKGLLENVLAPKPANAAMGPVASTTASGGQGARVEQAEALLRDYADEFSMAENQLERQFLQAVRDGSEVAFKRSEKLRNRLHKSTRWGGREPFKTTLKLLESLTGRGT